MSLRVLLIDEAVADLHRYAASGNLKLFLAKLVRLEDHGADVGVPLGRELATWRKIVVGNRDWRIVFRVDEEEGIATVCVIGDRSDDACYEDAVKRLSESENREASSLSAVMLDLMKTSRKTKARK